MDFKSVLVESVSHTENTCPLKYCLNALKATVKCPAVWNLNCLHYTPLSNQSLSQCKCICKSYSFTWKSNFLEADRISPLGTQIYKQGHDLNVLGSSIGSKLWNTIRMRSVESKAILNIVSIAWLWNPPKVTTEQSRKGLRESLFPQKPATHLLKAQSLANWWALIPAMCCSQWLSSVPEVK